MILAYSHRLFLRHVMAPDGANYEAVPDRYGNALAGFRQRELFLRST